jgi:hypothetical protein
MGAMMANVQKMHGGMMQAPNAGTGKPPKLGQRFPR